MDIVSVAAPKRRRRRKQESDMVETAFIPQFSMVESEEETGDSNPSTDPLGIVERPIDEVIVIEIVETEPKSRDIGNWQHRVWKGMPMWYNLKTHRTSFDERFVRKHRHE